ncbi:unnamed protein product [marine sediment metagenome]|uniref:VTT domain-containing protein n=2 Tax=marine sediment metagenome TaxID=412755 RepID=X1AMN4_9ZZZZ
MEAIINFLEKYISQFGYLAIFILMFLESACVPIPSEITMPFGGFLAAIGNLNLILVTMVGSLANLFGSYAAYYIGKLGGRPFLDKYGKYILLRKEELDKVDEWFNHRGEITVFITRLLPGIRTFISLPAGMAKMNLTKFSIYTILGVMPWCFLLAYLGYIFGENWKIILNYYHKFEYVFFAIIILIIVAFLIFMFIKKRKQILK